MDYLVHGILQARILEWVAFPFSKGSSQPGDRTQVFHTAGRFFASWAPREAQEHWSGYLIPSPGDLPDPGIEPGSPALQTDSLLTELWGKPNLLKLILLFLFTPGTNPMEQAVLSSSSCNWGNRRVFLRFIYLFYLWLPWVFVAAWAFSSRGEGDYCIRSMQASLVLEHRLQVLAVSTRGARA